METIGTVIVDCFDSADHLRGRKRTYESVKAAVLEAGRFSVFEATQDMKSARIFGRLCKDPELLVKPEQYPWTSVRKRESAE